MVNGMSEMVFITNPAAGAGIALKTEEKIREAIRSKGIEAEFIRSGKPGEATAVAKARAEAGCKTVAAIGGDGTNLEVAAGLMGTDCALGIIPAGTGNDLIKTLGIPKDPLEALDCILERSPKAIDMGLINGKPFLNVCGTGFDVSVLDHTIRFKKHFRGLLPYMLGLISAIFGNSPIHVTLNEDGSGETERSILLCTIANGRFIGGGIPICPEADPTDGQLDLVYVDAVPRRRIFKYLPGLMKGKILTFPITHHSRCRELTLRSPGMRVQIDGEIIPMDEVCFRIEPGALRVHC